MTLNDFAERLKKIDPNLNVRVRGFKDIVGIFDGNKYLIRMSKGEFNLNGYRYRSFNTNMKYEYGNIQKRGRKTVVRMLEKHGVIKTVEQRTSLLWGI